MQVFSADILGAWFGPGILAFSSVFHQWEILMNKFKCEELGIFQYKVEWLRQLPLW